MKKTPLHPIPFTCVKIVPAKKVCVCVRVRAWMVAVVVIVVVVLWGFLFSFFYSIHTRDDHKTAPDPTCNRRVADSTEDHMRYLRQPMGVC